MPDKAQENDRLQERMLFVRHHAHKSSSITQYTLHDGGR